MDLCDLEAILVYIANSRPAKMNSKTLSQKKELEVGILFYFVYLEVRISAYLTSILPLSHFPSPGIYFELLSLLQILNGNILV